MINRIICNCVRRRYELRDIHGYVELLEKIFKEGFLLRCNKWNLYKVFMLVYSICARNCMIPVFASKCVIWTKIDQGETRESEENQIDFDNYLTHFGSMSISIPPENIRKPLFFKLFRGRRIETLIGNGLNPVFSKIPFPLVQYLFNRCLNSFLANDSILYPLQTPENQWF